MFSILKKFRQLEVFSSICPGNIIYFSTPVSILYSGVELGLELSFLNVIFKICSSELKLGKILAFPAFPMSISCAPSVTCTYQSHHD